MTNVQSHDTVTLKFLKMQQNSKHFQEASTELIFIYLILYKIDLLHKTRNKTFIIHTVNDMFICLSIFHQQISNFHTKYQFETIICFNWNEKCKNISRV
jgi:hypothetical protein